MTASSSLKLTDQQWFSNKAAPSLMWLEQSRDICRHENPEADQRLNIIDLKIIKYRYMNVVYAVNNAWATLVQLLQ